MSYRSFNVTNCNNSGSHSLRDVINIINSLHITSESSTIIIKPSAGPKIILTSELEIKSDIKIINQTGEDLTITTSTQNRIFHVSPLVQKFSIESSSDNDIYCNINKNLPKVILSNGSSDFGGAIHVSSLSNKLTLKNVIIKNNIATNSGGGIFTLGTIKLINSKITKNQAGSQGAGIWSAQDVTLQNSTISKNSITFINSSSSGAGIYIDAGDCELTNSQVIKNTIAYDQNGGSAGGISVILGNIILRNSHVDQNSAYNSGGIQLGKGNIIVTCQSTVNGNQSFNDNNTNADAAGGGGIVISLGTVSILDSEVSHNITQGMYSAGIVTIVADVIVRNSKIIGNKNRGPGGGIAVNVGSINISDSQICDNNGASLGGAMVNFSPSPGTINIDQSTICGNKLTNAQTIAITIEVFIKIILASIYQIISQGQHITVPTNGIQKIIDSLPEILLALDKISTEFGNINLPGKIVGGGAIASLLVCPINVTKSEISKNYAGKIVSETNTPLIAYGGGVFAYNSGVNILDTNIENNKSLTAGGGIWSHNSLNLENSRILENKNISVESAGAGIYNSGKAYILDSQINENKNNGEGGGISNSGTLTLIQSEISGNVSITGGGVYSGTEFQKFESGIAHNKPDNIQIV